MRVGIIQSNYIPWRGYFDFINSVDLFVFYDDVQYTRRDWRNRNRIKTPDGVKWLSVPVLHKNTAQQIDETLIDYGQKWWEKHLRKIELAYQKMPYFASYFQQYGEILAEKFETISELNQSLVRWLMLCLGIPTPLKSTSELNISGRSTERLINILRTVGASHYLSGPSAAAYLDYDQFRQAGIALEYKSYDYPTYPQPHGPFVPDVSVLDLLFSVGGKAKEYLKSRTPDTIIVPAPEHT